MTITKQQLAEFQEAAKPLIAWLNTLGHPHVVAIVDTNSAMVAETTARIVDDEFIKD